MNAEHIQSKFEAMGARVKVSDAPNVRVNILSDRRGTFFDVQKPDDVEVSVVQVAPKDRHLLLMAKSIVPHGRPVIDRFLCGHDEREWFVAAVPGSVSTVIAAKDSLRPNTVNDSLLRNQVPSRARHRRHNKGYIRQGEWFFIPVLNLVVPVQMILKNEPIRRGRGKPHIVQELYRHGGETVYVNSANPNGITQKAFNQLPVGAARRNWRVMVRDAEVYARGTVRHSDHATVTLQGWHQVVMNTETNSRSMRHVAFLD
jgi:hypothetical protein